MAFTEFFCRSGGSNLNGGALASNLEPSTTPVYSGVGDSDGTSKFTPSDGSTPASTVTVGDFASVYVTSGATVATFIGRVTIVAAGVNGAITVSTTAKSGTFPASSGSAHTITCTVGGAWQGPNAGVAFPFAFFTSATTNVAGNVPRLNFKNDATYSISTGINQTFSQSNIWAEGYSSSAGDGGKATIDGSTNTIVIMTFGSNTGVFKNFIISNNGTTGSNAGLSVGGSRINVIGVVVHDVRGPGITVGGNNTLVECETYTCNTSNTSSQGGIVLTAGGAAIRCISHDNSGNANNGFVSSGTSTCVRCIADTNGLNGFLLTSVNPGPLVSCDSYNNGGDGFKQTTGNGSLYIESCNAVKNTGWGIDTTAATVNGVSNNCGFGSGTQANGSGTTTGLLVETGSVTYASGVTPWVDPTNGDFRINLATAKNAGRGAFLQTTPMTGAVTAASNATPIVITAAGRTMRTGETVTIAAVGGNTAANGTWVVTNVSSTTFSLNTSVGNGNYTSGGTYSVAYTSTVGYPDIGSAQHLDAGGGLLINPGMSGGLR